MLCDICNILGHDISYNILNIILNDFIHDERALIDLRRGALRALPGPVAHVLRAQRGRSPGTPRAHYGHIGGARLTYYGRTVGALWERRVNIDELGAAQRCWRSCTQETNEPFRRLAGI